MYYIKFLILSLLCFVSIEIRANEPVLKIQIENIVKLQGQKEKKSNLFSVKVNIYNNTNKTIAFWMMTCSWQDGWVSNSDFLSLMQTSDCDGNFPDLKQIGPNQKMVFDGIIAYWGKAIEASSFRLGLIYLDEREVKRDFDFQRKLSEKKTKKKDIHWSEGFKLPK